MERNSDSLKELKVAANKLVGKLNQLRVYYIVSCSGWAYTHIDENDKAQLLLPKAKFLNEVNIEKDTKSSRVKSEGWTQRFFLAVGTKTVRIFCGVCCLRNVSL